MRYSEGVLDVQHPIVANRKKKNLGQQFYRQGMNGCDKMPECGGGGTLAVAQFDESGNL
jgi:hypothetical protein